MLTALHHDFANLTSWQFLCVAIRLLDEMRVLVLQHQSHAPGKRLLRILDMLTSWAGLDMFAQ
jgi:hypothetical protein